MAGARDAYDSNPQAISAAITESRELRYVVHELVTHIRQLRGRWQLDTISLATRPRLTLDQRRRLKRAALAPTQRRG